LLHCRLFLLVAEESATDDESTATTVTIPTTAIAQNSKRDFRLLVSEDRAELDTGFMILIAAVVV
jgi:hypothetical protein